MRRLSQRAGSHTIVEAFEDTLKLGLECHAPGGREVRNYSDKISSDRGTKARRRTEAI